MRALSTLTLLAVFILVHSDVQLGQLALRNEENFAREFTERGRQIRAILETPLIRDLLKREIDYPTTAEATMTEERLVAKILENSETIFGQLDREASGQCLADMQTYFADLANESDYAWQSEYILYKPPIDTSKGSNHVFKRYYQLSQV